MKIKKKDVKAIIRAMKSVRNRWKEIAAELEKDAGQDVEDNVHYVRAQQIVRDYDACARMVKNVILKGFLK